MLELHLTFLLSTDVGSQIVSFSPSKQAWLHVNNQVKLRGTSKELSAIILEAARKIYILGTIQAKLDVFSVAVGGWPSIYHRVYIIS